MGYREKYILFTRCLIALGYKIQSTIQNTRQSSFSIFFFKFSSISNMALGILA